MWNRLQKRFVYNLSAIDKSKYDKDPFSIAYSQVTLTSFRRKKGGGPLLSMLHSLFAYDLLTYTNKKETPNDTT